MSITETIKEAVAEELKARDGFAKGLQNLKAKHADLQGEIKAEEQDRAKLATDQAEAIEAGKDATAINDLIQASFLREQTAKTGVTTINEAMPAARAKLKRANDNLKRVTFAAIQANRPDDNLNSLFRKALDSISEWEATYTTLLDEVGVRENIDAVYDGEWRLPLEPHLSNEMIVELNDFVPEITQPDRIGDAMPASAPAAVTTSPEKPKGLTDAEAQANAAENARKHRKPNPAAMQVASTEYKSIG